MIWVLGSISYKSFYYYKTTSTINTQKEIINTKIFPNPVKDVLRIESIENANISIYTIEGKLIKRTRLQNNEIDMRDLSAGNYLLKIANGKEVVTKQIVME